MNCIYVILGSVVLWGCVVYGTINLILWVIEKYMKSIKVFEELIDYLCHRKAYKEWINSADKDEENEH